MSHGQTRTFRDWEGDGQLPTREKPARRRAAARGQRWAPASSGDPGAFLWPAWWDYCVVNGPVAKVSADTTGTQLFYRDWLAAVVYRAVM